ncbi:hypothetical protein HDU67_007718 [Dinochytrium kinnereticum]|nr:hypothetical protein HDU67_007718 [Dinochytrium kinnereticum]
MFHVAAQAMPRKAHQGETIDERSQEWSPPLQRHLHPKTNTVEFVTLKVRLLAGDTENDYNAKFPPGRLTAEDVCACVADRQGIPLEARNMFALWIVGRDIEIQVRPKANLFQLVLNWNKIVVKYTHFPQALDPAHLVNRHWFIYRREATVSKEDELRFNGEEGIVNLLYGEAKRNVLSGRYICTPEDAAILGALQIQINLGNFDPLRRPPGYIAKNPRFLENIIPARMIHLKKPLEWEKIISDQHTRLKGTNVATARIAYLNMSKYHFIEDWPNLKWIHSDDTVILYDANTDGGRSKHFRLISPQSPLIHNLAATFAHLNRKGKFKKIGQNASALARFISSHPPAEGLKNLQMRKDSQELLGKVPEEDGFEESKRNSDKVEEIGPKGSSETIIEEKEPMEQADTSAILISFKPDLQKEESLVIVQPDIPEDAHPNEVPSAAQEPGSKRVSTTIVSAGLQDQQPPTISRAVSRADEALANAMEQAVNAAAMDALTPASVRKNQPKTLSSFQKRPSNTSFMLKSPLVEESGDVSAHPEPQVLDGVVPAQQHNPRRRSQSNVLISTRSRDASVSAPRGALGNHPGVLMEIASASTMPMEGVKEVAEGARGENEKQSNSDLLRALEEELSKLKGMLDEKPLVTSAEAGAGGE